MLDQLTLLVDKSLVVADDGADGSRYRLLETVRQYAQEKLRESGEGDDVRARHRDHYTATAGLLETPTPITHAVSSGQKPKWTIYEALSRGVARMPMRNSLLRWRLRCSRCG